MLMEHGCLEDLGSMKKNFPKKIYFMRCVNFKGRGDNKQRETRIYKTRQGVTSTLMNAKPGEEWEVFVVLNPDWLVCEEF